jgi:hypothetical protein
MKSSKPIRRRGVLNWFGKWLFPDLPHVVRRRKIITVFYVLFILLVILALVVLALIKAAKVGGH